jgi:hypothetical protein
MRKLVLLAATVTALAAAAPAAQATWKPPSHTSVTQERVVENATACGTYGVSWDIRLKAEITTFFDGQGRRVSVVQHITEDNTIKNTVTGLTLRDGPVDFLQTAFFDPETGIRERVLITGTSVNVVRGDERLIDRGTLMIDGQTGKILWSIGNVTVRRTMDGSFDTSKALPAFCHILR